MPDGQPQIRIPGDFANDRHGIRHAWSIGIGKCLVQLISLSKPVDGLSTRLFESWFRCLCRPHMKSTALCTEQRLSSFQILRVSQGPVMAVLGRSIP